MTTITLWKENRTDQEWTISIDEIVSRYLKSKYNGPDFDDYYLDYKINLFIGDKDGLNSVYEIKNPKTMESILDAVIEARDKKEAAS